MAQKRIRVIVNPSARSGRGCRPLFELLANRHVETVESDGARSFAELIRRGAPVYLKFGLSKAPSIYPYGGQLREVTLATARERMRRGRLALDLLARHGADGGMSPLDSRLPGALRRFPTDSGSPAGDPADR